MTTPRSLKGTSAPDVALEPLDGVRVLVTDDHDIGRALMEAMVSALGATAESAGSAEETLALAAAHRYDIALVDLNLPDLPGDRLAAELARIKRFSGTPIVAVTGLDRPPTLPPAFAGWLTKPYGVRDLYRTIAGLVRR